MLFKLSNLNSTLALTLGYLNPALNNSTQISHYQADNAIGFLLILIRWIVTNPVDNAIPWLNNCGQKVIGSTNIGKTWIFFFWVTSFIDQNALIACFNKLEAETKKTEK